MTFMSLMFVIISDFSLESIKEREKTAVPEKQKYVKNQYVVVLILNVFMMCDLLYLYHCIKPYMTK